MRQPDLIVEIIRSYRSTEETLDLTPASLYTPQTLNPRVRRGHHAACEPLFSEANTVSVYMVISLNMGTPNRDLQIL